MLRRELGLGGVDGGLEGRDDVLGRGRVEDGGPGDDDVAP